MIFSVPILGQDISIYQQYSGRFDFTFMGNTLNTEENNAVFGAPDPPCIILTSSSASLNLGVNDEIQTAFLYWAGSGNGDFDVKLNGIDISASRTFSTQNSFGSNYFSAFKDVTSQIIATGNGIYNFSDLDLTNVISDYCGNTTNFGGWAIIIIYKNDALPLNQLNIYDGLQSVPSAINIILNSLNVVDNQDAKIGFVAWEGDKNLQVNETLKINGNTLSNALNPANNAFNGTNTETGATDLYNMDLDVYDIQNNIAVGDTSALIQLTSSQDFVMVNCVVTKLNSELPDATIQLINTNLQCNSRVINIDYTVSNLNATKFLPANTPISFYANGNLVGNALTNTIIPINGSETGTILLNIPVNIPDNFVLKLVVDDVGTGTGIVTEIIETNNIFNQNIQLFVAPKFNIPENLFFCVSDLSGIFVNFSNYSISTSINSTDIVQFFTSFQDANNNTNPILNSDNFFVNNTTTTIFIRIDNLNCKSITSFEIRLVQYPDFNILDNLNVCKQSINTTFDLSVYNNAVVVNPGDNVQYYESLQNSNSNINPILNINNYLPNVVPKQIFVRIDNGICYSITSFYLDYLALPTFNILPNLVSCNEGLTVGTFNFANYENLVKVNQLDTVHFFSTENNAISNSSPILIPSNYSASETPKTIFVRIENEQNCYNITSFDLTTKNCLPVVYNGVSANFDGFNDTFFIDGLRNIFMDFQISVFNRWGKLVWMGTNNNPDWDGFASKGIIFENTMIPEGTYFYVLELNDADYPNPLKGYLYLTK